MEEKTLREALLEMDQWHHENNATSQANEELRLIAQSVFILMQEDKIKNHVQMHDKLVRLGLNPGQILTVFAYCCVAGAKSIQQQNEAEKIHKP